MILASDASLYSPTTADTRGIHHCPPCAVDLQAFLTLESLFMDPCFSHHAHSRARAHKCRAFHISASPDSRFLGPASAHRRRGRLLVGTATPPHAPPMLPSPSTILDPPLLVPRASVPLAVRRDDPQQSQSAGLVQLVADRLAQLRSGLVVTPAAISTPAAAPAQQRLVTTRDAQLATLLPAVSVTRFESFRLYATVALDVARGSPAQDRRHRAPPSQSPPPRTRLSRQARHRADPSPPPRPGLSRRAACPRDHRATPSPPTWPQLSCWVARARRLRATPSPPPPG